MPVDDPTSTVADEGLHPAGDDPDWQESAYLAWRDPSSGLGGNHRIGNEPNRRTSNLWCGVYSEDGTRFRCNGEGLEQVVLDDPATGVFGVCAGPQRIFHDGTALRYALDGDGCRADFVITDEGERSFANAKTFSGATGATGTIFSNNFHVACRVTGTVELDGRQAEVVDAPAWRDHSWGVRRWDSFVSSRSFGGSHGEGDDALHFRFASMVGSNGSFFRVGSLSRGGAKMPVADASMLVQVGDDSVSCPAAEVHYDLEGGGKTVVRIDTIGGMIGVTAQRHGWESVGDVTVDGVPGGWGFLETTLNARNGSHAPGFVLNEAMTNGIVRPS
ncbi:MAG: hypothetical protein WAL61_00125 [Acidimicrobiales bacterium]